MSNLYLHPKLTSQLKVALNLARDPDPALRVTASPLSKYVAENDSERLVWKAVGEFAPLKAVNGLGGTPSYWVSPSPSGAADWVVVIFIKDPRTGKQRCIGSNQLAQPAITTNPCPSDFVTKYDALLKLPAERLRLLTEVTACAVSGKDRFAEVERICKETSLYRTMPILLIAIDKAEIHLLVCPALVEGPRQSDYRLAKTGEVK